MTPMTERPEAALRGRIDFEGSRTPLKTTLFVVLCVAWLVPGLIGHDPWKVDEATAFGAVTEMLRSGDWVRFRIAGEPEMGLAPLYLWVAALNVKLLGGLLAAHDAARLASGYFIALTLAFLSFTCRELMGGRGVRASVMLFIGSLGLLLRAHEMVTDLAGLAGLAIGLHGLALALRRPWAGGAVTGLGAGVAFLGDGFLPLGMLVMLLGLLPLVATLWRTRRYVATLLMAALCAAPLIAGWLLLLAKWAPDLLQPWLAQAAVTRWSAGLDAQDAGELLYFVRILPWYAWPAWPLAAWAIWRSRRTLEARKDLMLPLVAFGAFLLTTSVFGAPRDVNAIPLLLPLAVLGVAELDSLPRGAASALDWFGVTTFFLFGALLWLGFFAALTGRPEFAAAMLAREVPGYRYAFSFFPVALAALLTLIWIVVVARSLRSTRRALVNWAAGITMVWMLVMTLGIPLVDQARSYRGVAARLLAHVPRDAGCIARRNVGDAQRALLDYFAGLRTVPLGAPAAAGCGALLVQAVPLRAPAVDAEWQEVWRGSRPGDRNEMFILYERRR